MYKKLSLALLLCLTAYSPAAYSSVYKNLATAFLSWYVGLQIGGNYSLYKFYPSIEAAKMSLFVQRLKNKTLKDGMGIQESCGN